MDSSRIFVRGLPPNFTEVDFKKHFSKLSPITDAKFMPKRRIGYVGYQNQGEAEKAVKYFNKSFIRMSRVVVELARPFEKENPLKTEPSPGPRRGEMSLTGKRKREGPEDEASNPKLKEFLEVMQPPSKTKTWMSGGNFGGEMDESTTAENAISDVDDDGSDQDYQSVVKKKSTFADQVPEEQQVPSRNINGTDERPLKDRSIEKELVPSTPAAEQVPRVETSVPSASDADWLRSRTSRLLGLVNDDELEYSGPVPTESDDQRKPSPARARISPISTSDTASQTDMGIAPAPLDSRLNTDGSKEVKNESPSTSRLFVRNLCYTTTESDLKDHFSIHGTLEEIHVVTDSRSGVSKGFAYVQYADPEVAKRARSDMDGKSFQGRLLHILPAAPKRENTLDEFAISKMPIKKQQQIRRKAEAASSTFKWNSMYMNADAVVSSISNRLGISKSEILDPTSSDAAIKQAHAETNIIQETKSYFGSNGVNLKAFQNRGFSDSVILVKNFPYSTTTEELRKLFEAYGSLTKLLMPPSGTTAILEFELPAQARSAFGALSYRKFKDSILFLEKAPKCIFDGSATYTTPGTVSDRKAVKLSAMDLLEETDETPLHTSTLFVKNLNFSTTNDDLHETFRPLNGFISARIKTKLDPKRPGQILSMGFGFLEFKTKKDAQSALQAMNRYNLDGHELLIKESHKALDAAEERTKEDVAKKLRGRRTKIIIKNLPFEATKKDVRALFGSYGQLRSVRVPKKFDSSTRGFAFADFVTAREAENAMDALRDTHLLGRRLVLDFAAEDAIDPEEEIEKMQKKVGKQADKVTRQKLTGAGRKKFTVYDNEDN